MNNMKSKKQRLIEELEHEYNNLPEVNGFGHSNNLANYPDAIHYLKTGENRGDKNNNDLLLCCIEDIETMYSDYDIFD